MTTQPIHQNPDKANPPTPVNFADPTNLSDIDRSEDVTIGKLLKPRGIEGEVFCHPLTDFVERFYALKTITVVLPGGRREVLTVERARLYGKRFAFKFKGIHTPEAVTAYRNALLVVPKEDTFDLPDGTFYIYDIVGMMVVTDAGDEVGPVKEVLSLPGNDVYVVDRKGEEVLIPASKELVTIDRDARKIVVQAIEGLI